MNGGNVTFSEMRVTLVLEGMALRSESVGAIVRASNSRLFCLVCIHTYKNWENTDVQYTMQEIHKAKGIYNSINTLEKKLIWIHTTIYTKNTIVNFRWEKWRKHNKKLENK